MTIDMSAPVPSADAVTAAKPGKARPVIASIVLVFAFLLTPFGTLSYSAHETLVNQGRYLETVGPIATDPHVQGIIANAATEAIVERVDLNAIVESTLGGLLGDRAGGVAEMLVGPLASGLRNLVYDAVLTAVASQQFETAWIQTNTAIQRSLIALLEGRTEGILQTQGETIVLDVNTLINDVRAQLAQREGFGFLQRIAPLEEARLVPIVVVPGLEMAQSIFRYANPAFGWFPLLLALMYVAAILIARRRARMTIVVGGTLFLAAIVTNVVAHQVWDRFSDGLDSTPFEAAADAFWGAYSNALLRGIPILFGLALLVLVAGIVWMVLQRRRAHELPAADATAVLPTV